MLACLLGWVSLWDTFGFSLWLLMQMQIECYKEGQGWESKNLRAVGKRCFAAAIVLGEDWSPEQYGGEIALYITLQTTDWLQTFGVKN